MAVFKTSTLFAAISSILSLTNGAAYAEPFAEALAASTPVHVSSFTGPLLSETLGNPSVLYYDGMYYAYASHFGEGSNFKNVPTALSKHLAEGWTDGPDALMYGVGNWTVEPKGGVNAGLWTPDVSILDDGRLIMYYSAHSATAKGNERCIGVAYADKPLGPWIPTDEPFYCPPAGGAIGVDGIKDGNDRYVLFKDESHVASSHIALWPVSPSDGATKLSKAPYLITKEPADLPGWEGPALTKMPDGRWLLLHTTGIDTVNYTLHWATADNITDVYTEGGVLLGDPAVSNNGTTLYRPGGPDFIGSSNTQFMFFGIPEATGNARRMYYGELVYTK